MSRFVRASKYRHVYGQTGKKEFNIENVKVSNQAWDTNLISASDQYIALNWAAAGGGAFSILPLPSPWGLAPHNLPVKLPDLIPLARGHTAPVLDTTWSPFNDSVVASGGDDGKICIWKVEPSQFDNWGTEHWEPQDFDPVQRIDASPRKVGQVLFHPTASHVLASASGDHVVKLWDLASPDSPRVSLTGATDTIQSIDFNPTGTLLATTSRDRKMRVYDPRTGGDAVLVQEGHGGVKGARVIWMGDTGKLASTGFSKMSDRQVGIWDMAGGLNNSKMILIDQSAGIIMPFWSDNGILFLAGKGDGNVRYYEYESDTLHLLSEYKSSDPQRGMCFLPRRALNVSECEIARAYKVISSASYSWIEPVAFVVPRKADSFQADIFPPAPSTEPSLTAGEFFSGHGFITRKVVDLSSGTTSAATALPPTITPSPNLPPHSPLYAKAAPLGAATLSTTFKTAANAQEYTAKEYGSLGTLEVDTAALMDENTRLTGELREARTQIRSLELQLEAMRANAQRAAKVLLEG